jgi:hypothetical protein
MLSSLAVMQNGDAIIVAMAEYFPGFDCCVLEIFHPTFCCLE